MIFIKGNVPSSKNSRVWTGKFFIPSRSTQTWRKESKPEWDKYREEFLLSLVGKELPYRIEFTFVRKSKHQFDYANPLNSVQDEMVHNKWISDDNADVILPSFAPYIYDKNNPGVFINVL